MSGKIFDFILNYGWTVLIVLAGISAIFYFNTDGNSFIPSCYEVNEDTCKYESRSHGNVRLTGCESGNIYVNPEVYREVECK